MGFGDDIVRNTQSQAGPFSHLFGGKKRLKDPVQVFLVNAFPGVGDGDENWFSFVPGFYRDPKLINRPGKPFVGRTFLTAQQIEDVVAYLVTLKWN